MQVKPIRPVRGRFNREAYIREYRKRWSPVVRNAARRIIDMLDKQGVLQRYDVWFQQAHPRVTGDKAKADAADAEQLDMMTRMLRAPVQRWWRQQEAVAKITDQQTREIAAAATRQAFGNIGVLVSWTLDEAPPFAELIDTIVKQRLNLTTTVPSDTIFEQVKGALVEQFYSKGASPVDAKFLEQLKAIIPKSTEYIAERIARTETATVQSQMQQHTWQSNNVTHKRWAHSGGANARPSHAEISGETVPIDEPFSIGLQYPHDPSGDAGEVINCRCHQSPVVTDEIIDRIAAEGAVTE